MLLRVFLDFYSSGSLARDESTVIVELRRRMGSLILTVGKMLGVALPDLVIVVGVYPSYVSQLEECGMSFFTGMMGHAVVLCSGLTSYAHNLFDGMILRLCLLTESRFEEFRKFPMILIYQSGRVIPCLSMRKMNLCTYVRVQADDADLGAVCVLARNELSAKCSDNDLDKAIRNDTCENVLAGFQISGVAMSLVGEEWMCVFFKYGHRIFVYEASKMFDELLHRNFTGYVEQYLDFTVESFLRGLSSHSDGDFIPSFGIAGHVAAVNLAAPYGQLCRFVELMIATVISLWTMHADFGMRLGLVCLPNGVMQTIDMTSAEVSLCRVDKLGNLLDSIYYVGIYLEDNDGKVLRCDRSVGGSKFTCLNVAMHIEDFKTDLFISAYGWDDRLGWMETECGLGAQLIMIPNVGDYHGVNPIGSGIVTLDAIEISVNRVYNVAKGEWMCLLVRTGVVKPACFVQGMEIYVFVRWSSA